MERDSIEELRKQIDHLEHDVSTHLDNAVNKAAENAVHHVFSLLGVDVDDPADMQRFRDDLRFGGVFRNAATKGFIAMIAALCGGIGLSVWLAIKEHIGLR